MERRLSAIMAADVVGYSRLMGANEVGTLAALNHRRTEVIEPRIASSNGRVVKLTGDGMLSEFPSVVDAVECALAVQREMKSRNVEIPEDRRIELRIGIHLGDVIAEEGDIFGDGVNVASRIEGVGRAGGVAVSAAVMEHVGNRLEVAFEDMGEHNLKNIARPVHVYNVSTAPPPVASVDEHANAVVEAQADTKPSIAVLPFNNMSGDPEQEYFSDGITEDIITDLSKVSALFVVGRNTSFTYKGKSLQLQQVAAELGVKFLLEGSVRKVSQRVRVTGQLIDGATGGHLWADRYDRDLTDIFAIQDENTKTIVEQLKVRLLPEEKKAIGQAPTASVEAYTYFLRGREFFNNSTRWFLTLARQMFAKAVEIDPSFARAYAGMANCDTRLVGWYGEPIPFDTILATAGKALAIAPDLAEAHAARGEALSGCGKEEEARQAFERALEIDPNCFEANLFFARHWARHGEAERAIPFYVRAVEVQPDDYQAPFLLDQALRSLGRKEEGEGYGRLGIKRAEQALIRHPESSRPAQMGACVLANLGEVDKAKAWMERALAIDPDDTHIRYNAACMWAQLGDIEKSLDLLQTWASHVGPENKDWMLADPDIDPVRQHPRYAKLLDLIESKISERVIVRL
jgi:adenylate cyclase